MKKIILFILICLLPSICYPAPYEQYRGLPEIAKERTYNQKVYDNNGSKRYRIHIGHIHYKDEVEAFQELDCRLIKNGSKWEMKKASYNCEVPEYADGEFVFYDRFEGKSQYIRAIPQASHVKGQPIPEEDGFIDRKILYPNAFGQGIDLKVTTRYSGFLKEIIVREKPDPLEDLHFDFEIILDSKTKRLKNKSGSINIPDLNQIGNSVDITGKTVTFGEGPVPTYLRQSNVWDDARKIEPVKLAFYTDNNKLYLRKTITKEFLKDAVYPVTTDHPTNYYVGAGDGQTRANYATWDATHNAASGTYTQYTTTPNTAMVAWEKVNDQFMIRRFFLPIDTSGIDDGATITAADFKIYSPFIENDIVDDYDYFTIVQTTQTDPTEVVHADYSKCGDVHTPTEGIDVGDRIDLAVLKAASPVWASFPLNATGIGWIDKEGWTKLGMREGHDIEDVAPPETEVQDYNQGEFRTSEYADTDFDPYLDVTVEEISLGIRLAKLVNATIYGSSVVAENVTYAGEQVTYSAENVTYTP